MSKRKLITEESQRDWFKEGGQSHKHGPSEGMENHDGNY